MLAHINLFGIIKSGSNLLVFHSGTGWEYFFQGLCPGSNCLFHGYTFVSVSKLSFFRNRTNHFVIQSKCSYFFYICSIHFKKKITVSRSHDEIRMIRCHQAILPYIEDDGEGMATLINLQKSFYLGIPIQKLNECLFQTSTMRWIT